MLTVQKKKQLQFYLLRIPLFYLYTITIFLSTIIIFCWCFFYYLPKNSSLDRLQQSITNASQQVFLLKKFERELSSLQQSIAQSELRLKGYAKKKLRKDTLHENLSFVATAAVAQGLAVKSCRVGSSSELQWCSIYTISFDGHGTLNQMIDFLEAIKNSKALINGSSYELTRIDNDNFALLATFKIMHVT